MTSQPNRLISAVAPIRICDNGGWTDTWFAGHGSIFNIGVYPYIEVQVEVLTPVSHAERISVFAENYDQRFTAEPGAGWNHHPLIEAAIERMSVPDDITLRITIFSEMPSGASTGTSASVAVALIGALDLLTPGRMTPHEVAYAAHAVETEMLKRQSGIQDQLCAAYGGINFIDMHAYPRASVSQLHVPDATWWELERRLALIFLGKTHDSSQVHEKVIRELEDAGPDNLRIATLRRCAERSRDAMYAGDLYALGQAMVANTEAQAQLNPALVSADAHRVIEIARAHGATGWKVNGAGGDGGSLTLLCGDLSHQKREMVRAIEAESTFCRNIPIYLSRFGLRVWESIPSA
jgi:D-glycero-alpha-D-manno-heptose-7-phosphate kinase